MNASDPLRSPSPSIPRDQATPSTSRIKVTNIPRGTYKKAVSSSSNQKIDTQARQAILKQQEGRVRVSQKVLDNNRVITPFDKLKKRVRRTVDGIGRAMKEKAYTLTPKAEKSEVEGSLRTTDTHSNLMEQILSKKINSDYTKTILVPQALKKALVSCLQEQVSEEFKPVRMATLGFSNLEEIMDMPFREGFDGEILLNEKTGRYYPAERLLSIYGLDQQSEAVEDGLEDLIESKESNGEQSKKMVVNDFSPTRVHESLSEWSSFERTFLERFDILYVGTLETQTEHTFANLESMLREGGSIIFKLELTNEKIKTFIKEGEHKDLEASLNNLEKFFSELESLQKCKIPPEQRLFLAHQFTLLAANNFQITTADIQIRDSIYIIQADTKRVTSEPVTASTSTEEVSSPHSTENEVETFKTTIGNVMKYYLRLNPTNEVKIGCLPIENMDDFEGVDFEQVMIDVNEELELEKSLSIKLSGLGSDPDRPESLFYDITTEFVDKSVVNGFKWTDFVKLEPSKWPQAMKDKEGSFGILHAGQISKQDKFYLEKLNKLLTPNGILIYQEPIDTDVLKDVQNLKNLGFSFVLSHTSRDALDVLGIPPEHYDFLAIKIEELQNAGFTFDVLSLQPVENGYIFHVKKAAEKDVE